MTVLGYCRVSTADQAENGESLDIQQRKIRGYCEMHGLGEPVLYVERGVSAADPMETRPEGAKLLAAIKPGDTLVAATFDRAFRSALDALTVRDDFKARKIDLVFIDIGEVTRSAVGMTVFMVMAALAEGERERGCERNRDVKRDQRERGRFLGGNVPFGYRVKDGELIEHEPEQAALRQARKWKKDENLSNRKLAAKLGDLGFKVSHVTLGKLL